jgi:hypothetical protein
MKENYITELENQIELRDEILAKLNEQLQSNFYEHEKFKSIKQLKNEYCNKLPIINTKDHIHSISINSNLPSSKSNNNLNLNANPNNNELPPISISNLNSIMTDMKNLNNNITKIEKENLANNRKDKSKIRSENYMTNPNNQNLKEAVKEKMNQVRNYSQGVRNLNMGREKDAPIQGNISNANVNNLNNVFNIVNNAAINTNNNVGTPNNLLLNNKLNNRKNNSSKGIKKSNSKINLNLKKYDKDSNSEKSYVSNNSQEDNSDIIDLDGAANNSGEENLNIPTHVNIIKKRNNHFKDRKSAMQKEESPISYVSPFKKEFPKFLQNYRRDESGGNKINNELHFAVPFTKKKDLNVFLNDKNKFKNQKKMPFKI